MIQTLKKGSQRRRKSTQLRLKHARNVTYRVVLLDLPLLHREHLLALALLALLELQEFCDERLGVILRRRKGRDMSVHGSYKLGAGSGDMLFKYFQIQACMPLGSIAIHRHSI